LRSFANGMIKIRDRFEIDICRFLVSHGVP
jgi:hypothetical protein